MLRIEELKAGPLEEQTMILTAEPTLLALAFYLILIISLPAALEFILLFF